MNKLSVIISFKNEGEEVIRTCLSIRETALDKVDIILVNDNSDDNFDYENELKPYNVNYHYSNVRLGTSGGRELALSFCKTPYFLILDGHCRMYSKDWYKQAIKVMEKNEDCIYCCTCIYFDDDKIHNIPCYGSKFNHSKNEILNCKWNLDKLSDEEFIIPCILGANYLCSKRWWDYIKGLQGLTLYGRDEPYLSYKSWMLGGLVKCIPQIVTLHKSRKNGIIPYNLSYTECLLNELIMSYILCPHYYQKIINYFNKRYNNSIKKSVEFISSNKDRLDELLKYVKEHLVMTFDEVDKEIKL